MITKGVLDRGLQRVFCDGFAARCRGDLFVEFAAGLINSADDDMRGEIGEIRLIKFRSTRVC